MAAIIFYLRSFVPVRMRAIRRKVISTLKVCFVICANNLQVIKFTIKNYTIAATANSADEDNSNLELIFRRIMNADIEQGKTNAESLQSKNEHL